MAEERRDVQRLGHDLRNHLFVLSLGLQALESDTQSDETRDFLRKMREEITAAEKIADALQGIEPPPPAP